MQTLTQPTPAGPLTVLIDETAGPDHRTAPDTTTATVIAAGFTADADALAVRAGLAAAPPAGPSTPAAQQIADALAAWVDGDLAALDAVAIAQPGTDFQQQVWAALRAVPPGQPATYGDLAAAVGRPAAVRAVGSACGANRIAPFVPCHRAVRSDGGLGGYAWGLDAKRWLLALESGGPSATWTPSPEPAPSSATSSTR